jgi:hypothetical protein
MFLLYLPIDGDTVMCMTRCCREWDRKFNRAYVIIRATQIENRVQFALSHDFNHEVLGIIAVIVGWLGLRLIVGSDSPEVSGDQINRDLSRNAAPKRSCAASTKWAGFMFDNLK